MKRPITEVKTKGAKRYILFFLVGVASVYLHFFFQFRTSDTQTLQYFEKSNTPVAIEYISSPTYPENIRVIQTKNKAEHNILFVHGAPGSSNAFYSYLEDTTLLSTARLITYDRPGYGYSGFGNAMTSIVEQAEVLNDIIKSLNLNNVIVVGHSYGGPIAALAALSNPSIKGLVMLSPAIDPKAEKYYWIGQFAEWEATKWLVPEALEIAQQEKSVHAKKLMEISTSWNDITIPTLIIHGRKDVLAPFENMRYVENTFSNAQLDAIALPNANHFIPWTQKKIIIEELVGMISADKD
ncbi:alpha/beta hydrolase [Galbibacter sp. BG1]|uniref:alpha/beta fold hydrolase n=1 Tax=Galbibacter sp. BG1 TaxID=1170699 RepID=UPI0015C136B7|nr:alpha/beta hydrolase [Galbibacter sp. BG1]QLE01196.1 alpha/beta hydrolase [Galbibacter sp. BG1]